MNGVPLIHAICQYGRVDAVERPLAWLSLDEDDNDPVRFFHYFVAALARLVPGLAERADSLDHDPFVLGDLIEQRWLKEWQT